jgi:pyridoxal phosphate enzyme (YggS family)
VTFSRLAFAAAAEMGMLYELAAKIVACGSSRSGTSMSGERLLASLRDRLARVEEQIASACRRSGRARQEVNLVVVTKSVSVEIASLLPQLGIQDLGESRPQELWRKAAALPGNIRWHQVGHLQSNKIERTLPLVHLIHSADRPGLLQALEQECRRQGRSTDVLLEVNASGEFSKHGFAPEALPIALAQLPNLRQVRVRGLMTMAAFEENPEKCRPTFARLRQLRDQLGDKIPAPHSLQHLSMGMSNDFPVAIEEGATMIRLGTALFDGIQ